MISRQYNRKIKIYRTVTTDDGFGGNTITQVLIGTFWAEIKQNSAFRDTAIGMSNIKDNWSFNIRSNPTVTADMDNLTIEYKGVKRVVNDIRYNDELFRELNIIANGS
jgi:SPP1 family predicted phage head-tail adaptor